jgi:hypothetical protein
MASPLSGVQKGENFDVLPYAEATADYLLQFAGVLKFPRKLKVAFSNCSIGRIPSGCDAVTIGDADMLRINDKKHVYLIGVNRTEFPASVSDSAYLTDRDKHLLESVGVELGRGSEELAAKDKLTLNEYIKKIYGKNVKVDDIKKSLEIFRLANKMRYKDYNDVVISDSELEELAKKEGNTYLQREILVFELTLSNLSDKTAKIKEYAQKMKEATTAEEFRQLAADFIKTDYCVNLSSKKEVATETVQNNVSEDDKDALTSWFFASGTTVGSTYLKEGTAAYTVYMAASEPAYDETPTRNLYTIVFEPFAYGSLDACKAKAEEVYNKWKADGATLEGFKALAMQYSTDQVSVYSGGLYANMMKDQMIEELDKWLFDENLSVGSHTIMSAEQGCHIVYYAGEGVATWKAPLVEQIREEKATELSSNYSQTYRVVTLEGNMKYVKAK